MTGRIFITGDKHGTFVPLFGLVEKNETNPKDILIIAGDAGYVWKEDYKDNVDQLQQIFSGTIAFIDGNHENHGILNSLEVIDWNGGRVHKIGERFYHLMRGEMYSIYGNKIFTFGGARSVDKDRREDRVSWWEEEEPTAEELEYGKNQLIKHLDEIDYVITHETPLLAREFISRQKPIDEDYNLPTILDEWYNIVLKSKSLKKWYFGHMHADKLINPKLRAIHSDIVLLGDEKSLRWL
ncbi:MAG: hypothetical protein ACRCW1_10170 [Anaerotignaceae bacterium]